MNIAARPKGHAMHIGIAEAGKVAALKSDHSEALRHYREALKLAQSANAPEVFFRHYTQCVLESLELTGAYDDVIAFCENAIAHYAQVEKKLAVHRRDEAAMLERCAINKLKAGQTQEAQPLFDQALEIGEGDLPVSRTIRDWLARGMTPQPKRLSDLQRKHDYFSVRADQVDTDRAIALPQDRQGRTPASAMI